MFSLLAGVKPWEWVLLGALAVFGLIAYVAGTKYLDARDTNVKTQQDLVTSRQETKVVTNLSELSGKVVAEAIQAQTKKEADLTVSRQGVIDEYLNPLAVQPDVVDVRPQKVDARPTTPAPAVAKAKPQSRPKATTVASPSKPTPASSGAATAAKLTALAAGMQQRFCSALPDDPSCHRTATTAAAVQGGSTTHG